VLVGMPGCGKSSVARRLARRTGRRAVDVDAEIERVAGRSIPDLFATDGEAAFRTLEHEVLTSVLAGDEPLVVATGGGAVLRADNRDAMRGRGTVIWLRATAETLQRRVGDGATRPLLAGDALANLQRLDHERRDAYAASAHVVVDVDHVPFDQVVERVLDGAAAHRSEPSEVAP
jgi:shikimate kinase